MTLIDQGEVRRGRYPILPNVKNFLNLWGQRSRQKHDHRILAQQPDWLLRDIGLDHLIERDRVTKFDHRW